MSKYTITLDFTQGSIIADNVLETLSNLELSIDKDKAFVLITKMPKVYHLTIFYHVLLEEYCRIVEIIKQSQDSKESSNLFKFEYDFNTASVQETPDWVLNENDIPKAKELLNHFESAANEAWNFIENTYKAKCGPALQILKKAILNQWGIIGSTVKGHRNYWLELPVKEEFNVSQTSSEL